MDEIVRAMSAENDRLLSVTHDSQQRHHRHSSVSNQSVSFVKVT